MSNASRIRHCLGIALLSLAATACTATAPSPVRREPSRLPDGPAVLPTWTCTSRPWTCKLAPKGSEGDRESQAGAPPKERSAR
jgi:hypothetical protein